MKENPGDVRIFDQSSVSRDAAIILLSYLSLQAMHAVIENAEKKGRAYSFLDEEHLCCLDAERTTTLSAQVLTESIGDPRILRHTFRQRGRAASRITRGGWYHNVRVDRLDDLVCGRSVQEDVSIDSDFGILRQLLVLVITSSSLPRLDIIPDPTHLRPVYLDTKAH